jgi:hypothetical protein
MRRGLVDGKKPIQLKSSFLFGTHHKTGTIWMGTLLGNFCRDTYRKMSTVPMRSIEEADLSTFRPTVVFDYFSKFYDLMDFTKDWRGVSIVRHPKDQIISATRYHKNAIEPWLHRSRDEFGGMTYAEKLNSLDSWEEQVDFEMRNRSIMFSRHMIDHRENILNIKYEDMVSGYPRPDVLDDIFDYLSFDEEDRSVFEKYYIETHKKNSINLHDANKNHIYNGDALQWLDLWPSSCDDFYKENYLYVEKQLGY